MFVQNGSKMVRNWSGMVPDTSGTLLGHFWEKTCFSKNEEIMKRPHGWKPILWTICLKTKKTRIEIPLRLTCRTASHLLIWSRSWQKRTLDILAPYGDLWARARTLMGPMGPGQDPYGALRAQMNGPNESPRIDWALQKGENSFMYFIKLVNSFISIQVIHRIS